MNFLFFLVLVRFSMVYGLLTPVYKWHLSSDYGGMELQKEQAADTPPDADLIFRPGPNENDGHSVYFNGKTYIKSTLQETATFLTFSLCMFVYPEAYNGTIFHYAATSEENAAVHVFSISGTGSGSWSVYVETAAGSGSLDRDNGMTLNSWHFVCLTRDGDNKLAIIHQDSVVYEVANKIPTDVKEMLPGVVQFGGSPNGSDFFTGRIACVTYYDSAVSPSDRPVIMKECQIPPVPGPTCRHLWPLDSAVFGYELKETQKPTYPVNSACMRFGEECPSVPNKSIYLDGGVASFLQTSLPLNVLQNYITVAFYVRPMYPLTGTLIHFYSRTNKGIKMLKVRMSEGHLNVSFQDSEGSDACGVATMELVFSVKSWYYVGIYRRGDVGEIIVTNLDTGDSSRAKIPNNCVSAVVYPSELGEFRIGGAVEGGDNFRGLFRCLAVYDGITDFSDTLLIKECTAPNISLVPPFDYASCREIPPMRNDHFKKLLPNAIPMREEVFMTSFTVSSTVQCSCACLAKMNCRSVSVQRVAAAQYVCKLYDFATMGIGLQKQLNTDYFVLA